MRGLSQVGPGASVPSAEPDELSSLQPAFLDQASRFGLCLTAYDIDRLFMFLGLLRRWNATHNLTAVHSPEGLVRTHLIDPLLALPFLRDRDPLFEGQTMLDVGSGSGVPAIPWALMLPGLQLCLVEKVGKKAAFLRHAASRLDLLSRVSVMQSEVERLQTGKTYDMIVSRAFAALPKFLLLTQHLSVPGTCWLYMAGRLDVVEGLDSRKSMYTHPQRLPKINGAIVLEQIDALSDPSGMQRHLLWLRRVS